MKFVIGDIVQLKRNHPHAGTMQEYWFTTAFEIIEAFYVAEEWKVSYHIKPLGNLESFKDYDNYLAIAKYEEDYWDYYGEFAIVGDKKTCTHPNKKYVVNGINCQYWYCPSCKQEIKKDA